MDAAAAPTVIWQRTIDPARRRQRIRRLGLSVGAPFAVIVALLALTGGTGAALGGLVVGLLGALVVGIVVVRGFDERSGAQITFDGRYLRQGAKQLDTSRITSFTTYGRSVSSYRAPSRGVGRGPRPSTGFAVFELADGSSDSFIWPAMPPEQINEIRVALERVLPGRWAPHSEV